MMTTRFAIGAVLALFFGYIIGWDRENLDKPAGITTHSFVILGAMIFTILSSLDPSGHMRIAAAVVQGIGFLGAGMIIKSDDKVENLTTAAGVWVSAGVGMALGHQLYLMAFMTVVMMFCARFLPHPRRKQ